MKAYNFLEFYKLQLSNKKILISIIKITITIATMKPCSFNKSTNCCLCNGSVLLNKLAVKTAFFFCSLFISSNSRPVNDFLEISSSDLKIPICLQIDSAVFYKKKIIIN